jgi:diguanylate cyclase (GGDEF)-like protein
MEQLATELARTARYLRPLALLLLDVDGLKAIHAALGSLPADEILRELAALLRARVRRSDVVARYGGDVFAVLLVDTGANGAAQVAEHLRCLIEGHLFRFQGQAWPLTVSLGLALAEGPEPPTPDELIRQADARLCEAKRAGGNRTAR